MKISLPPFPMHGLQPVTTLTSMEVSLGLGIFTRVSLYAQYLYHRHFNSCKLWGPLPPWAV